MPSKEAGRYTFNSGWFDHNGDRTHGLPSMPTRYTWNYEIKLANDQKNRDCHDRDRMIVGIKTTYAISAFHHGCYEFESRSGWGVQHYVIKFVSDFPVFSTYKTEGHDITEILLKVALNAIKQTNKQTNKQTYKIMRKIYKKKREKKEKC